MRNDDLLIIFIGYIINNKDYNEFSMFYLFIMLFGLNIYILMKLFGVFVIFVYYFCVMYLFIIFCFYLYNIYFL